MRTLCSTAFAAALIGLASRGPVAQDDLKLSDFRWRTDLEAARKDAAAAGRPLLIVFR